MRILPLVACCFLSSAFLVFAQEQAQPAHVEKIGPGVTAPVPLKRIDALYPQEARKGKQTGLCLVSLIVDAQGFPTQPQIIRCTDSVFEKNSLAAVMQNRFKPGIRKSDGTPVPVRITFEIAFRNDVQPTPAEAPPTEISYRFFSPPGTTSPDPDANGFYPLTKLLEMPRMTKFESKEFGKAAMSLPAGVGCHVLLSLNAKGKPVNGQATNCDKPWLENAAVDALMHSKYTPAKLNGKDVPVRMLVHIVYDGFGPKEAK